MRGRPRAANDEVLEAVVVVVPVAERLGRREPLVRRLLDRRPAVRAVRAPEERGVEAPARRQLLGQVREAEHDRVEWHVGEHRQGEREVERAPEVGVEGVGDPQRAPGLGQPGLLELVPAAVEHLGRDVDPVVVAVVEVPDEVDPAPQGATADVEHRVVGLEPLGGQELQLEGADDVPVAPDPAPQVVRRWGRLDHAGQAAEAARGPVTEALGTRSGPSAILFPPGGGYPGGTAEAVERTDCGRSLVRAAGPD